MNVTGVDPGARTGWVVYNCKERRIVERGTFDNADVGTAELLIWRDDRAVGAVVIEKPVAHGPTRPQVVDCAFTAGELFGGLTGQFDVHLLTRLEVKQILTEATLREVRVKDDATAWAALRLLHGGDGSDKKMGPLHGVKAHERAAAAVAVAWALRVGLVHFDLVQLDERQPTG